MSGPTRSNDHAKGASAQQARAGIDDPVGYFGNALQTASYKGDEIQVKQLLDAGANVNARGGEYNDALQAASYRGYSTIVAILLKAGADVHSRGGFYGTALQAASYSGHWTIVEQLLEAHADPNSTGGVYPNPIAAAVERGHKMVLLKLIAAGGDAEPALYSALELKDDSKVLLLLDAGASANVQDAKDGTTLLQLASYKGNEAIVQYLLAHNANVNAPGGRYGTALQAALLEDHLEVAERLLKAGADIHVRGGEYETVLQAACVWPYENASLVAHLLASGADVNAKGGQFGSALQAAASRRNERIVTMLIEAKVDVNIQGGEYGTALQAAAYCGDRAIVKILLEAGADVNIQGGKYGSALQAAAYCGDEVIVKILLEAGADINVQGGEYGSALQVAISDDNERIFKILLEAGADVNFQGGEYSSALQMALSKKNEEITLTLLERAVNVEGHLSEIQNLFKTTTVREARLERFAVRYNNTLRRDKSIHPSAGNADYPNNLPSNDRSDPSSELKHAQSLIDNKDAQEAVTYLDEKLKGQKDDLQRRYEDYIAAQRLLIEACKAAGQSTEAIQAVQAHMTFEDDERADSWLAMRKSLSLSKNEALTGMRIERPANESWEGNQLAITAASTNGNDRSTFKRHLLLLHIVKVLPKHLIKVTRQNDHSWGNTTKLFLESHTGYAWDWAPLSPPKPHVQQGEVRLEWKILGRKGALLLPISDAEFIQQRLEEQIGHPPWCLCCRFRAEKVEWITAIQRAWKFLILTCTNTIIQNSTAIGGQNEQLGSKEALRATGSNEPISPKGEEDKGTLESSKSERSTSPVRPPADFLRYVLFSVRGISIFPDVSQIPVEVETTDEAFFRRLLRSYRETRRWWKLYLSPYRFYRCRFVQLIKMGSDRLISDKDHLPDSHGYTKDYDYQPRPPEADIPLLLDDEWRAYLQVCDDACFIRAFQPWHKCWKILDPDPEQPTQQDSARKSPEHEASRAQPSALCRIPKRKAAFDTISHQRIGQLAFGIETDYEISAKIILGTYLITIAPTIAFWVYWLIYHPGDFQNASVPFFTVAALHGALFIVAGR